MAISRLLNFQLSGVSPIVATTSGTSDVITDMGMFHSLGVQRVVTAAATEAGDTLAVYLQTSYDQGTNWVDVARFADVAGNASVPVQQVYAHSDPGDVDAGFLVTGDINLTATNNVDITLGDRLRLKWVVTQAATNGNESWTFTVKGIARG